jgi:hypothetical protein
MDSPTAHHFFQIVDLNRNRVLNDHCSLHVLKLNKWQASDELTAEDQWGVLFFRKSSIVESVFQCLPACKLIHLFGR